MFKEKYKQENENILVRTELKTRVKGFAKMNIKSRGKIWKTAVALAAAAIFGICVFGIPKFTKNENGEIAVRNGFSIVAYAADNSVLAEIGTTEKYGDIAVRNTPNDDGASVKLFITKEVKFQISGDNIANVTLATQYGYMTAHDENSADEEIVKGQGSKEISLAYPAQKDYTVRLLTDVQDEQDLAGKEIIVKVTTVYNDGTQETKEITIK
jgi:hypothetical protein